MDRAGASEGLDGVRRGPLRRLSRKSDFRGAVQTLSHLLAIAGATSGLIWLVPAAPWTWPVLVFAQGVLINCLYAGQHELSHWTVFRTRWLNDGVGHLFGFVTLNPFLTDRYLHFAHHRATQDPARDPELMGTGLYTLTSYALDLSGISFWFRRVRGIAQAAAGRGLDDAYWLGPAERRTVIAEARLHIGLWLSVALASLALRSWAAVGLWLAPMLLTKGFHQLQNTGEHTGLPHLADPLRNTRTLIGPAPMRWLMWNMSYHTAHHCFPGVPFHALPALHREIAAAAGAPLIARGYLAAQRDIFAGLMSSPASA